MPQARIGHTKRYPVIRGHLLLSDAKAKCSPFCLGWVRISLFDNGAAISAQGSERRLTNLEAVALGTNGYLALFSFFLFNFSLF